MIVQINEKFKNKYFRRLSIIDHLRECLQRYDKYKLSGREEKESLEYELDKELMDLLILLEVHKIEHKTHLIYKERIERFLEKIKESDNNDKSEKL